jgi:hypothetical protein
MERRTMKGSRKPKKLQKKQPQKSLKERRAAKRANGDREALRSKVVGLGGGAHSPGK